VFDRLNDEAERKKKFKEILAGIACKAELVKRGTVAWLLCLPL
jgi:hypothetical protein